MGVASKPHPLLAKKDFYIIEGDEISLSFDLQEKGNNFQFKLSSLEATGCGDHASFIKLFSSHTTVVTATIAKEIEAHFGCILGTSFNSTGGSLSTTTLNSFLLINVTTFNDDSHSMAIKMNVQTFEAVFWLPLVTSVLELIDVIVPRENIVTEVSVV